MADLGETYRDMRERTTSFLRSLTPEQLATRVPACPDWTVLDTVAHHVGVVADGVAGDFTAMLNASEPSEENARARDEATARQVAERRGRSLDEVIGEWAELAKTFEPIMSDGPIPGAPPFAEIAPVLDVTTHLMDVRGALGMPGDLDAPGLRLTLAAYVGWLGIRHAAAGAPPLRLIADDKVWTFGEGDPAATARGSRFEIMRAASGRRTADQVRALDWDGDPAPFVELFNAYGSWPAAPLPGG